MNEAQLEALRKIAADMQRAPQNWEWIGEHASQRMFGITEQRAKDYARQFGGTARKMS